MQVALALVLVQKLVSSPPLAGQLLAQGVALSAAVLRFGLAEV